ncbi:hypothetical protein L1987_41869 [Smallanthus sonchifolius]|uniref:Uncharacterized protein n=1 Tax=Smallanthus sonchifolius TaxID=185202 RepID=A0ACB9GWS7_9ASTR|nr:hypothetical protein L1987_41869 [Smallanthus sonchifolius]
MFSCLSTETKTFGKDENVNWYSGSGTFLFCKFVFKLASFSIKYGIFLIPQFKQIANVMFCRLGVYKLD